MLEPELPTSGFLVILENTFPHCEVTDLEFSLVVENIVLVQLLYVMISFVSMTMNRKKIDLLFHLKK